MSTTCCFFLKDPSDTLDYSMDWSLFLPETDGIVASEWSVPSGITMVRETFTAMTSHIWLSGGTVDVTYILNNKITTSEGRVVERAIAILVVER
jgi:hypothetical protein